MQLRYISPKLDRIAGSLVSTIALLWLIGSLVPPNSVSATIPNRQPWVHQPGTCPPTLEGAVFGLAGDACGGSGTSFDTTQIYGH
ncbi:hypothetical protein, partial [uncultured Chloroflexus sp.]|uniref:hypothetical protein n=1 Tax=uncultured Chloroflexus sp. TaxID=214040 RepID=UPI002623C3AA